VVDIYSISPKTLLNSYFGYTSQAGTTGSAAPFNIADAGSKIAIPTNFPATLNVEVGGDFNVGLQAASGEWNRGDVSDREIVTFLRGNHEIQVGGEWRRIFTPMGNSYQADGEYFFDNGLTGDNLSDFLLGNVSSFTQGGGLYLNFTGNEYSFFVQDNWHASKRLTINAGLRWDPFTPYNDSLGRVGCFVPGAQSIRFPNSPQGLIFGGTDHDKGCPRSSIYDNLSNVGPRLGFAYALTRDNKTSLRGGAGYYYQSPNTVAFQDVVGIPPFAPIVNITDTNFTDPYGAAGIANPFPAQFGPSNPGSTATFPQNISFTQIFDRHFRLPMILSYNLTLERGFGATWFLRAEFTGNHGSHLGGTGNRASSPSIPPSIFPMGRPKTTSRSVAPIPRLALSMPSIQASTATTTPVRSNLKNGSAMASLSKPASPGRTLSITSVPLANPAASPPIPAPVGDRSIMVLTLEMFPKSSAPRVTMPSRISASRVSAARFSMAGASATS
jgi:hypothetical protein